MLTHRPPSRTCECYHDGRRCTLQKDMSTAREVLARILLFGVVPGGVLAALFMAGQTLLPAAFTTDAAVIAAVANVVPLLAICMVRGPRQP